MISTAFINIWGKRVGAVAWDAASGMGAFEFERAFTAARLDLAPLTMPIAEARGRIFSFPGLRGSATFKGLPGLLADILPDKYGNALINAWLAKQGRPANSLNPVETLCFIGNRGMGALEFEPVHPKDNDKSVKLEISGLIGIAEDILSGRKDFHASLTTHEEKALNDILKIGTSAGGARAKAVIAWNARTRELRSGQADAPKGFTQWLIKFDGVTDTQFGTSNGYGRVEMAYYNMAKDAGIAMMPCMLLEENGRAHFMTRRFDRDAVKGKVHAQSLCALQHFDFNEVHAFSYEQVFETLRIMALPYPQHEQLFRRMVLNVMGRNCDDHTRNISFLMNKAGKWSLSPAYDVCHAYRPGSDWVSQHALSVNGKRKDITRADLLEVARQVNIKKAAGIINQVSGIVANWKQYAAAVNVEPVLTNAIGDTLIVL